MAGVDGGLHQFDFPLQTGGFDLRFMQAEKPRAERCRIASDHHRPGVLQRVNVGENGCDLRLQRIAFYK